MKKKSSSSKTQAAKARSQVSAYIARQPPESRRRLKKMRADIRAAAPRAVDGFSYGVPSARIDGQTLVWFAAFKDHCSIFPGSAVMDAHKEELKRYSTSKGTIRFPVNKPLPAALVKKLVKMRIRENEVRTAKRRERS